MRRLVWGIEDANLNDACKAAMALFHERDAGVPAGKQGGAKSLKEAQRACVPFRDKACAAEDHAMKGGGALPLLVNGCMRQLT
jgi:uncharacterized protein YecT (DUF1311 family)